MKRIATFVSVILLFATCKKADKATPSVSNTGHGVFIVNQGDYGHGNSTVSYYNLDSNVINNNLYGNANGGVPLGDVAQSMTIVGSNAYVVVNNSQRVEYVNAGTFKVIASIDNFLSSPRYLLPVTTSKAYVTNEYSPYNISIINTTGNTITGTIPVNGWTEQMVQAGNEVFVTAPGGYNVYVINSLTDAVTDSISLGSSPTNICKDKNGMIWVYCVGNDYSNPVINPSLFEINPSNHTTVKSFNFPAAYSTEGNLCTNTAGDSLFFVHQDIYRMSITDTQLPATPFISSNGGVKAFYGLLKVPDGRILACDAKDYSQNGALDVYSGAGTFINTYDVGTSNPSDMVYY